MREILFRGKPVSDGEYHFFSQIWKDNCKDGFVYGSLVADAERRYICVSAMRSINTCINNGTTSMIEVIPETVGQFIGLLDKNDKEIFEGDICRTVVCDMSVQTDYGVVCYDSMGMLSLKRADDVYSDFFFHINIGCVDTYSIEVICNIHDNPELLR